MVLDEDVRCHQLGGSAAPLPLNGYSTLAIQVEKQTHDMNKVYPVVPAWFSRNVENKSAGFTLVEVAIALGIVSFGFMSIVGLLVVGLSSLRGNVDRMAEVQILDWARATTKAARSEESMSSIEENDYGFDGDGLYTGDADLNSIYSLRLESSNIALPGSQEELAGVTAVIRSPARGNQIVSTNAFWFDK